MQNVNDVVINLSKEIVRLRKRIDKQKEMKRQISNLLQLAIYDRDSLTLEEAQRLIREIYYLVQ